MTETDPEDLNATNPDDHLHRAVSELGEPDALFRISPARFTAKLTVGIVLFAFGLVANYLWWVRGPARIGHIEMILLVMLPLAGAGLLWHMYRNRGLHVLIYPTGLLRLRRGEIDSFPWRDVDAIRLKVERAVTADVRSDDLGTPTAAWLPAHVPTIKIWEAGLTVGRTDGVSAHFGPALTDFEKLAEEVQRRTFAVLWPDVWERFRSGHAVAFDDLELSPAGLRCPQKQLLPWREVKEVSIAQHKLSIKQSGKWLPWYLKDASSIPNPHVLFVLVEHARRLFGSAAPKSQPHEPVADHKAAD